MKQTINGIDEERYNAIKEALIKKNKMDEEIKKAEQYFDKSVILQAIANLASICENVNNTEVCFAVEPYLYIRNTDKEGKTHQIVLEPDDSKLNPMRRKD